MALYTPDRSTPANYGQIGNMPDYGTYKSGYDYVNIPQDNPVDIYNRFKFSPIQLTIIEKALKTNPAFKQSMLNHIKKIINENPDITRDQLKDKLKKLFMVGTLALGVVTNPSWMNAFAATGGDTNNIPSEKDIKSVTHLYKNYGETGLSSTQLDTLKWIEQNKPELIKTKQVIDAKKQQNNDTTKSYQSNNISIDTQGFSPKLINYIKTAENAGKSGYKDGRWFPHKSPEGGRMTIGYGHKIENDNLQNELNKRGLSNEEVEKLLIKDLLKAKKKVYNDLNNMGYKNVNLTKEQEEMLIDYVFNLGTITGFPKFTKAVLTNNHPEMLKQYKRYYGGGKELTGRNELFLNTWLK